MVSCKRQVKARRQLACDHYHSLVNIAVSGCGQSIAETAEEWFTFRCLGCWNVDCLTAGIDRLTDIVKGMEMRMTKETYEIESDGKERGRKQ